MLPFAQTFVAIAAAILFPSFVGLLLISAAGRSARPAYLAAFAFGIYLWFWSDTAGDASYLDVNQGYAGGLTHAYLVLLFAAGVLLMAWADRGTFSSRPGVGRMGFAVPVLVAFAVGFHGFGEGAAFSETAAVTAGTDLLSVFGGLYSAVGFVLHKALEPMIAGAAYLIYAKDHARGPSSYLSDILVLTIVFSLPGLVGGATDYFLGYDATYFFAFGLGTSTYAVARMARPLFWEGGGSTNDSLKVAAFILLGLLAIYMAALFHSTG
ncbi:MAG: hypothetical protein JRN58_04665 [Nitrososphaerota archaeon]|nr:hypothetical protein [Nitrososphaerota archaeon]MDG6967480.1 hypothetical protein [Nitrososphaerota archaeon]MDG6978356.1 hypothetical protein [Nitrososphaerota archaeon]